MNKLTCPVCDKSQIEGSICPNCETNLSTYEMLAKLPIYIPTKKENKKTIFPIWLPISLAIILLILGLSLGFTSNYIIQHEVISTQSKINIANSIPFHQRKNNKLASPTITDISANIIDVQSKGCGGFNYTVRQGDSLSLIANHFYGDSNLWSLISEANSAIQGRESWIEIDEVLLIPNSNNTCPSL